MHQSKHTTYIYTDTDNNASIHLYTQSISNKEINPIAASYITCSIIVPFLL